MAWWTRFLRAVDRTQRRYRPVAFGYAVHKRFGENRGGHNSALVAYFGFLSIFPLMVALTNILGLVLKNRPGLRDRFVEGAAHNIPLIGDQIAERGQLSGNTWAIVIGVAIALWGGLRAMDALQYAYDTIWGLPERSRPNFFVRRALGLLMVAILGGGSIAGTTLTSIGSRIEGHPLLTFGITAITTTLVNGCVLLLSYEILTKARTGLAHLWLGALFGGLGLTALQFGGSLFATRMVTNASPTYGAFAVVIGLLAWFSIQARIVLYSFEINVVRQRHLWPRGIRREDPTAADEQAKEEALARLR